MKYEALGNSFFSRNRSRFVQEMKANSVAIFNSNDLMPTNADATFPFKQNNNLFYLSGVDQEETSLMLFPSHDEEKFREMLFMKIDLSSERSNFPAAHLPSFLLIQMLSFLNSQ